MEKEILLVNGFVRRWESRLVRYDSAVVSTGTYRA